MLGASFDCVFQSLIVAVALAFIVHFVGSLELERINCKLFAEKLDVELDIPPYINIYFPHEYNQTVFYHCGRDRAVIQTCGVGTIFSLRNLDCRRPAETGKWVSLAKFLKKKNVTLSDFYEPSQYDDESEDE